MWRLIRNLGLVLMAAVAGLSPVCPAAAADPPPNVGGRSAGEETGKATHKRAGMNRLSPCLSVEVEGHTALSPDCIAQRLELAGRAAQGRARAPIAAPVIDAAAPDVRTGVASRTATHQRMGDTFGISVHPQRPGHAATPPRP